MRRKGTRALTVICIIALAPQGLWAMPTQSPLVQALKAGKAVNYEETEYAKKWDKLAPLQLARALEVVKNEPLEMEFGKNVLTKLPLSIKMAFQRSIAQEEDGETKAFVIKPIEAGHYRLLVDYLDPTENEDIRLALTLRRRARIVKFKIFVEEETGKTFDQWARDSDGEGGSAGPSDCGPSPEASDFSDTMAYIDALSKYASCILDNAPTSSSSVQTTKKYRWLCNDIFEPVTIVMDPEILSFLGINLVKTGPAFAPLPTLNLQRAAGGSGYLMSGGKYVLRPTDSFVLMQDLGDIFPLEKAVRNDTLADVVGHELFHGIQSDLQGKKAPGGLYSISKVGHDAPIVSDRSMGFSEGWAEFFEAFSGANNDVFDDGNEAEAAAFLIGRQTSIRTGRYKTEGYAYDKRDEFENRLQKGQKRYRHKTGNQLVANEGAVATFFYKLVTGAGGQLEKHVLPDQSMGTTKIENIFEKIFTVMNKEKPADIIGFVKAFAKLYPEDKEQVIRSFLLATDFTTVSPEARQLYEGWFTALANGDKETYKRLRVEAHETLFGKAEIRVPKHATGGLFKKVVDDPEKLGAAIGPDRWFDGIAVIEKDGKQQEVGFRLNLNTVTQRQLEVVGISKGAAQAFVDGRDNTGKGWFKDIYEMDSALKDFPEDYEKLKTWRATFIASKDASKEQGKPLRSIVASAANLKLRTAMEQMIARAKGEARKLESKPLLMSSDIDWDGEGESLNDLVKPVARSRAFASGALEKLVVGTIRSIFDRRDSVAPAFEVAPEDAHGGFFEK